MSEHNITVEGGTSVRLPTGGKYCDRDIIVTAEGGGVELPELTNPAEETDVVNGKEFIDEDGSPKAGTVAEETGTVEKTDSNPNLIDGFVMLPIGAWINPRIELSAIVEKDTLFRVGSEVKVDMEVTPELFGNATAGSVRKGNFFTSSSGFRIEGSFDIDKYIFSALDNNTPETYEVISGKKFFGEGGELLEGDMPNIGAIEVKINAGEQYPIPEGYHNGEGYVEAAPLSEQTEGTAEAGDIWKGKTAWVNGELVTGTHECASGGSGVVCTITFCDQYGIGFDVALPGGILNVPSDGTPVTAEVPDGTTIVASQTSSMGALSHAGCLEYLGTMNANNEVVAYFVTSDYGTTGSIELVS